MKYLYHLTTEGAWEHIREEGLKPQCGQNSYLCCENQDLIFLCDGSSLPYWAALLNANVLLRLPENRVKNLKERKYTHYSEFLTKTPVAPADLEQIPMVVIPGQIHEELCVDYLEDISSLVVRIIRIYRLGVPSQDLCQMFTDEVELLLGIVSRLKYQDCDPAKLVKWVCEEGDSGEYTLADTYKNTDTRLWEQLLKFEDDNMAPARRQLSSWINENLSREVRYARTGGYTTK